MMCDLIILKDVNMPALFFCLHLVQADRVLVGKKGDQKKIKNFFERVAELDVFVLFFL